MYTLLAMDSLKDECVIVVTLFAVHRIDSHEHLGMMESDRPTSNVNVALNNIYCGWRVYCQLNLLEHI